MKSIAILGLGLMGGSLGLALRKKGFVGRVAGYARNPKTRAVALQKGMVDEVFEHPAEAVRGAELAVFCVPVLSVPEVVAECRAGWKAGAVLTDVGSTKEELIRRVEAGLAGVPVTLVGSHPIAGSERQGIEAARGDLYEGATVIVTGSGAAAECVAEFWRSVGGVVVRMSAEEHDRIMARTSHLPHVVASGLAATVGREQDHLDVAPFCGTGFRDTTRVAAGSPQVWLDIVQTNRAFLKDELEAFKKRIDELIHGLESGDQEGLRRFLEEACERRRQLTGTRSTAEEA